MVEFFYWWRYSPFELKWKGTIESENHDLMKVAIIYEKYQSQSKNLIWFDRYSNFKLNGYNFVRLGFFYILFIFIESFVIRSGCFNNKTCKKNFLNVCYKNNLPVSLFLKI